MTAGSLRLSARDKTQPFAFTRAIKKMAGTANAARIARETVGCKSLGIAVTRSRRKGLRRVGPRPSKGVVYGAI